MILILRCHVDMENLSSNILYHSNTRRVKFICLNRISEKMADGEKAEGKSRKNNMKSKFLTTANIFVKFFFTLIGFNLGANFIEII